MKYSHRLPINLVQTLYTCFDNKRMQDTINRGGGF